MDDSQAKVTVFLLDDHEVVREGLRHLLETDGDLEVVGEAGTASEAIELIPQLKPRVAVLDVRLPDGNGVEVCREIRSRDHEIACLMLTSFSDDEAIFDAIVAGASGYVLKEVRGSDLVSDIRKVAAGHSLLDPDLTARVMERMRAKKSEDRTEQLTHQEQRILDLIAEGLTNRQIADIMYLSEKTVKNYVSNMLAKLGMSRRTEAAVYAVRHGSKGSAHEGAERNAGSVPERNAGSVPERNAGSVPERNAGSVPERNAGSVPERNAGGG
jgi:two-component system response regulator DevR